jgi:muramidase (phage lysozyme)
MYKLQDVPDYAVLSELCYLLDGANLTRLLTYLAGKTLKIPTQEEFANMSKAMLLYQYINLDGNSLSEAQSKLTDVTPKQQDKITELYLKIIPVMQQYNIDRGQIQSGI